MENGPIEVVTIKSSVSTDDISLHLSSNRLYAGAGNSGSDDSDGGNGSPHIAQATRMAESQAPAT